MKIPVVSLLNEKVDEVDLPKVFETPLKPEVIRRAVIAQQSHDFQPQGRDPMAGKRTTAESRGTGSGAARIPRRKTGAGKGAFAPGTVSGRQAHPPLSEKNILRKISKKERKLALFSAIAATASKELVARRGHNIEDVPQIPLIVTSELEELKKAKEVEETLIRLGVLSELFRVKDSRKVRAGRGKSRGRKMKQASGPLIVVAENKGIAEAARNIPGVDVVVVSSLNTEMFAPGTHPGRLTMWTSSAIERLAALQSQGGQA